jgi:hypothetical protein
MRIALCVFGIRQISLKVAIGRIAKIHSFLESALPDTGLLKCAKSAKTQPDLQPIAEPDIPRVFWETD